MGFGLSKALGMPAVAICEQGGGSSDCSEGVGD